jgi:hypothetical protein
LGRGFDGNAAGPGSFGSANDLKDFGNRLKVLANQEVVELARNLLDNELLVVMSDFVISY